MQRPVATLDGQFAESAHLYGELRSNLSALGLEMAGERRALSHSRLRPLPIRRLRDDPSSRVQQCRWKLAGAEQSPIHGSVECCLLLEMVARFAQRTMRAQDADREFEFVSDEDNGFHQVGIVGDHNGLFVVAAEAVGHEVGGETDVGCLFFPCPDGHPVYSVDSGVDQHPLLRGLEEPSLVNQQIGKCLKRSDIDQLPSRFARVGRIGNDVCRKVSNEVNRIVGKRYAAERAEVEPLVRCLLQTTI
jgi:hypothetical protein